MSGPIGGEAESSPEKSRVTHVDVIRIPIEGGRGDAERLKAVIDNLPPGSLVATLMERHDAGPDAVLNGRTNYWSLLLASQVDAERAAWYARDFKVGFASDDYLQTWRQYVYSWRVAVDLEGYVTAQAVEAGHTAMAVNINEQSARFDKMFGQFQAQLRGFLAEFATVSLDDAVARWKQTVEAHNAMYARLRTAIATDALKTIAAAANSHSASRILLFVDATLPVDLESCIAKAGLPAASVGGVAPQLEHIRAIYGYSVPQSWLKEYVTVLFRSLDPQPHHGDHVPASFDWADLMRINEHDDDDFEEPIWRDRVESHDLAWLLEPLTDDEVRRGYERCIAEYNEALHRHAADGAQVAQAEAMKVLRFTSRMLFNKAAIRRERLR